MKMSKVFHKFFVLMHKNKYTILYTITKSVES